VNIRKAFYEDLEDKVLERVTEGGKHFVFWGFTPTCVRILYDLNNAGLLEYCVEGIIDSDPKKQKSRVFHYSVLSPEKVAQLEIDTLVVASDEGKELILKDFAAVDNRRPTVLFSGSGHYAFRDSLFEEVITSCPVRSKAGGYPNMLIHIYQSLVYLVENNIKGDVAEFGMFQGGTTVIIAKFLEKLGCECKIYGFDTFGRYPPRKSALDLFSSKKCEFHEYKTVKNYCLPYNIELIKGDIYETYIKLKGIPLMFSFFDTDNYSPTKVALELCYEQTVKGGVLAFDHYFSEEWPDTIGERIAIKEVLKDKKVFNLHGTGIFIKL